jgi:drug/metabolite transporter (DMT)-like permease
LKKAAPYLALIILIGLALTWGSSFILMKKALKVFSPLQVGTIRIFLASLFLLPFSIQGIRKIPRKRWPVLFFIGLTGNALPAILFASAQTKLSSSIAGMLNALVPIFVLLIAIFVFKNKFPWYKIGGIILGLFGAVTLIFVRADGSFEINYFYGFLVLIATICYAISANLIKNYVNDLSSVQVSSMALFFMGPIYGAILFFGTNFIEIIPRPEVIHGFSYLIILSLFGTAIALIFYNQLIQMTNVIYASSVTYLMPLVALIWGWFDGEALSQWQVIALCVILLGVYFANKKEPAKLPEKAIA